MNFIPNFNEPTLESKLITEICEAYKDPAYSYRAFLKLIERVCPRPYVAEGIYVQFVNHWQKNTPLDPIAVDVKKRLLYELNNSSPLPTFTVDNYEPFAPILHDIFLVDDQSVFPGIFHKIPCGSRAIFCKKPVDRRYRLNPTMFKTVVRWTNMRNMRVRDFRVFFINDGYLREAFLPLFFLQRETICPNFDEFYEDISGLFGDFGVLEKRLLAKIEAALIKSDRDNNN